MTTELCATWRKTSKHLPRKKNPLSIQHEESLPILDEDRQFSDKLADFRSTWSSPRKTRFPMGTLSHPFPLGAYLLDLVSRRWITCEHLWFRFWLWLTSSFQHGSHRAGWRYPWGSPDTVHRAYRVSSYKARPFHLTDTSGLAHTATEYSPVSVSFHPFIKHRQPRGESNTSHRTTGHPLASP